jgi:SAM-dependent methyltransferase
MTDESARFFDAIANRYDRVYAPTADESRRRMKRVLGELPPPPASLLDLGVGTGRELPALLDAGYTPTGLDASAAMLDRCARRTRPVRLVMANFWRPPLPFDDGSFDAVIALHGTLAHPPDEGAVARLALDLGRVVRPGGVFVAEVPSTRWLDTLATDATASLDRAVYRIGPKACHFEDRVVGVGIDARILDESEWREALAPAWTVQVEALDALDGFEWLVVAHRA